MVEFVLVLPVCMMLFTGIAQFGLICMNAIMVKYAAYTVARAAISYVEPYKSDRMAQMSNHLVKAMLDRANSPGSGMNDIFTMRIPHTVKDSALKVEHGLKFSHSRYEYTRVTMNYDMELTVPVAKRLFAAIPGGSIKNGKCYFPLRARATMHSGVRYK